MTRPWCNWSDYAIKKLFAVDWRTTYLYVDIGLVDRKANQLRTGLRVARRDRGERVQAVTDEAVPVCARVTHQAKEVFG